MRIFNADIISSEFDVFWQDTTLLTEAVIHRPVLVITNKMEPDSAESLQLGKMLAVCNLEEGDYNMVYLEEGQKLAWHKLRHAFNPFAVFLMGVLPVQLGVAALFRLNEPNRFNDTIWLPAPGIADLEKSEDLKRHLWSSGMKPLFVDKTFGQLVSPGGEK